MLLFRISRRTNMQFCVFEIFGFEHIFVFLQKYPPPGWTRLKLVDFKIEFGRYFSEDGNSILLLADEISPDNCRLWDIKTNNKMDKDLFRQDIGGLKEAYQEVANRLGILPEKKTYSSSKTEIVK